MTVRARPRRPGLRLRGSAAATYQSNVLALNPLAYWPMTETSGTTMTDVSGNSRNGTYVNGPTLANTAGPSTAMGPLPAFDGVNDYGQLSASSLNAAFNPNSFTFCGWFKLTTWLDSAYREFLSIGVNNSNKSVLYKDASNNINYFWIAGATINTQSLTNRPSGWHHWALSVVKGGSGLRLLLDGTQIGATQSTNGTWAGTLADAFCRVGADEVATSPYSGSIGHVALFSPAISDANITTLATAV